MPCLFSLPNPRLPQVESKDLALERLLAPFEAPPRRSDAHKRGGESRVLDWLTAGEGDAAGERPSPPPPTPPGPQKTGHISNGRMVAPQTE